MNTITEAARAFLAAHDKASNDASKSLDREEEFEALEAMRVALDSQGAAPPEPWNGLKGLPTLRSVIGLLRESGRYVDEEGENTASLDDLVAWVEQQVAGGVAPPALEKACDLLSMTVGTLMSFRSKVGYTDNSPIAKLVSEVVEFLRPWPEKMPSAPQTATSEAEDLHSAQKELRTLRQEIISLNPLIPQNHPVWGYIFNYGDACALEAVAVGQVVPPEKDGQQKKLDACNFCLNTASEATAKLERFALLETALREGLPLEEPVTVAKALLARRQMKVRVSNLSYTTFLVNIQLGRWDNKPDAFAKTEAYMNGFNQGIEYHTAALLGLLKEKS